MKLKKEGWLHLDKMAGIFTIAFLVISSSAFSNNEKNEKNSIKQIAPETQLLATSHLNVSRHYSSSLSGGTADYFMRHATNVIRTYDGSGDTACNLTLRRSGNVGTFYTGDGSIDSQSELQDVLSNSGVNIVNRINYCGSYSPNIIGCAYIGSSSFVAVRYSNSLDGILWLHEYGHTRGLYHSNWGSAVMYPSIGSNRTRVTSNECSYFQQ